MTDWPVLGALALGWLGYFAVHSALASLVAKRWVARRYPALISAYRIVYNALAVLLLLPIVWLTWRHPGPPLWAWHGALAWLANALAVAAVVVFVVSLKDYDGREFIGLRQWRSRQRQIEDREIFHLSPFHRVVRHPWYCCALVLIWTRDMAAATLVASVLMTAYLIVGARLEEKKLLIYHGAVYRRYMARVAGLVPLPWKTLGAAEAEELVRSARRES